MNEQPQGSPQKAGEPSRQGGQPGSGQPQGQQQSTTPTQGGKPEQPCPPPKPDPCDEPTPTPSPTPPSTPCPDPCDQDRPWGPPLIPAECCPGRGCCPEEDDGSEGGCGEEGGSDEGDATSHSAAAQSGGTKDGPEANGGKHGTSNGSGTKKPTCTWDEVDDPCIRATAAKGSKYSILTCNCESSNQDCTCEQWEYGGYPEGVCVPCKPCEGLIPTDDGEPGDDGCGDDGEGGECDSAELQRRLDALKRCNSSRQGAKAKLDAEIKAGQDREKELATLVAGFDDIVKGYKDNWAKLKSREDTLKGFYRDTREAFGDPKRYPKDCLDKLQAAINEELVRNERIKCCQKNLEGKLTRVTTLQQAKNEADRALKKADDAFKAIKDLNKWIGDQFTALEKLRDEIIQARNDKDPQRYKWAFYLFYWKFVPLLCGRFPVTLCCGTKEPLTLGCKHGDWHPSLIDEGRLKALVCCAWRYVHDKKQEAQRAADALADVSRNVDYIKSQVSDEKTLDTRIQTALDKVACATAPATSR